MNFILSLERYAKFTSTCKTPDFIRHNFDQRHYSFMIHCTKQRKSDLYYANAIISRLKHFDSGNIIKKDILNNLDTSYTNLIVENISNKIRKWICQRIDRTDYKQLPQLDKLSTFNRMLLVHCFELFLLSKFPISSIGLTYCDSEIAIPAICILVDRGLKHGGDTYVIGLSQVKKLKAVSKLLNSEPEALFMRLIDLKSSLSGFSLDFDFMEPSTSRKWALHVLEAPSISSAVFPLVLGKASAMRMLENDQSNKRIWPIVCYPSSEITSKNIFRNIVKISNDKSYSAGGTVHIIVNNEIDNGGSPQTESSCKFVKKFAKFLKAPVIHVHGNDVDSVINSMWLAADYRATHNRDIVIDLIVGQYCNLPFKQMTIAGLIKELVTGERLPLVATYLKDLIKDKIISKVSYSEKRDECLKKLNRLYYRGQRLLESDCDTLASNLKKMVVHSMKTVKEPETSSSMNVLNKVGEAITKRSDPASESDLILLETRRQCFEANKLDWDFCEAMAFGTLLQEGTNVHVSCKKPFKLGGLVLGDAKTHLLDNLFPYMGEYKMLCTDVPLLAAAGFETGYSMVKTNTLNIWFAPDNLPPETLHSIIYNFLVCDTSEAEIGVTYVVPYYTCVTERNTELYYSSQPEKILDMFEEADPTFIKREQYHSNVMIASVSTPSNYFHLLKRQASCSERAPLILYIPHKSDFPSQGYSRLEDLAPKSCFLPVIAETNILDQSPDVKDIILCTGKLYFDLATERKKRGLEAQISILRIEQLYPFPCDTVLDLLSNYSKTRVWWAQEEEYNDGWWTYVETKLATEQISIKYAGRYHVTPLKYSSTKMSEAQLSRVFQSILEDQ